MASDTSKGKVKRAFTTGEVAKICAVSVNTVSRWFDQGKLKGYRMKGSNFRMIPREVLRRFMVDHDMDTGELDRMEESEKVVAEVETEEPTEQSDPVTDSQEEGEPGAALLPGSPSETTRHQQDTESHRHGQAAGADSPAASGAEGAEPESHTTGTEAPAR